MKQCQYCPHQGRCRVPREVARFDLVVHRLEAEHRAPALQKRLHFYVDRSECLVEAGYVDL